MATVETKLTTFAAIEDGAKFGESEWIDPATFITDFIGLDQVSTQETLYVRGMLDTSEDTVNEYISMCVFADEKRKSIFWIQQTIDYFCLSADELAQSDLAEFGIEANTRYIVNGRNRQNALATEFGRNSNHEYLQIQMRRLQGVPNSSLIRRMQQLANDHTVKHTTLQNIKAMAAAFRNYMRKGYTEALARKALVSSFKVTKQYLTLLTYFLQEGADAQEVYSLVDAGLIAPNTVMNIFRGIESINARRAELKGSELEPDEVLTASEAVNLLTTVYATSIGAASTSTGKTAITAGNVDTWVKSYLLSLETKYPQQTTSADSEEGDSETSSTEKKASDKKPADPALDRATVRAIEMLTVESMNLPLEDSPDLLPFYSKGSAALMTIAIEASDALPRSKAEVYKKFAAIAASILAESSDDLTDEQAANISKQLNKVKSCLNPIIQRYKPKDAPVQRSTDAELEDGDGEVEDEVQE